MSHTSDVHVITGLLKLYFRELADPIFPEALYNDFIRAARKRRVSGLPCELHPLYRNCR